MDWITGLQRAIDYVEAHLTEEIDYEMKPFLAFLPEYVMIKKKEKRGNAS